MKKLTFIALLLSFVSCSESDYRKIDKLLGLAPVPKDSTMLQVEIVEDTPALQPFKHKYDSAKVAKKMANVKVTIFKPIPKSKKGKNVAEILAERDYVGRREDAKFINSRRKLLDSIYKMNSKKAKP